LTPVQLAERPVAPEPRSRSPLLSPLLVTVALAAFVALVWALTWTTVL